MTALQETTMGVLFTAMTRVMNDDVFAPDATRFGGLLNAIRDAAADLVDNDPGYDTDRMEKELASSGLSMDRIAQESMRIYGGDYSTLTERYATAVMITVDGLLGIQRPESGEHIAVSPLRKKDNSVMDYYMHPGVITKADIDQAMRDALCKDYPSTGYVWANDIYDVEVDLRWLAEKWADDESGEAPEDRGSFLWWLTDRLFNGDVIRKED